mgnify:CR=1 FL=1
MSEGDKMISVIVPVYNVRDYLSRCIQSIIDQSYKNIEILIVDDGSTDGSEKICDVFAKSDKRVRVIHKKNEGLSSARNIGLDIAKGNYIGFVDSDDYIAQDMYESLISYMNKEIDIVCCGTICVANDRKREKSGGGYGKSPKKIVFTKEEAIEELISQRYISFSSCDKLYRKEMFEKLRFPIGRTSEDLPVVYELIKRSRKIVNIGKAKYMYCFRENSISRKNFYYRRVDYALFAAKICKDIHKSYPQLGKQAGALYIQYVVFIINCIQSCEERDQFYKIEKRFIKVLYHMCISILFNKYISTEKKRYYLKTIVRSSIKFN